MTLEIKYLGVLLAQIHHQSLNPLLGSFDHVLGDVLIVFGILFNFLEVSLYHLFDRLG